MASATNEPYTAPVQAWWTVAVFSLTSVVSVLDRGILYLVVDPVRHDLAISDVQIGLLQGLAFGLFYATIGLPLGLSADRLSRVKLIIAGITTWSLATVYGGLTTSYTGMFVSRILVGLGEATLSPAAISMISDMFPAHKRGRPISVFLMGQALASGVSLQLTGLILSAAANGRFAGVLGFGHLVPWRMAFVICGILGIFGVLLMLTVHEPKRRGAALGADKRISVGALIDYLRRNWIVFLPLYLGFAIASMAVYGMSSWLPSLLTRKYEMMPKEIGKYWGLASMIAGAAGALGAGYVIDVVARTRHRLGKLLILSIVPLLAIPAGFAFLSQSGIGAIMISALMVAIFPIIGTTVISATQEMVPSNMRGVAVSLTGFANAIVGLTTGPLLIAFATQNLFHDEKSVGASIAVVSTPALIVAALVFFTGFVGLKRMLNARGDLYTIMTVDAHLLKP